MGRSFGYRSTNSLSQCVTEPLSWLSYKHEPEHYRRNISYDARASPRPRTIYHLISQSVGLLGHIAAAGGHGWPGEEPAAFGRSLRYGQSDSCSAYRTADAKRKRRESFIESRGVHRRRRRAA